MGGAGYCQWRKGLSSKRRSEDAAFKAAIQKIHEQAKGRYGHRPVHQHLREEAVSCGRDRTLRLMKELGLEGKPKKRDQPVGTESGHAFGDAPNLLKEIGKPEKMDQVRVADTTCLYTPTGVEIPGDGHGSLPSANPRVESFKKQRHDTRQQSPEKRSGHPG